MSVFWNNRTAKLSPYTPGEQPRDRKFIKLNTNENPYPPSSKVIKAIRNSANERLKLYPDPLCTEFRSAVAGAYGVKPEQVFPGNGSDEVLGFAFGAFFESGETAQPILFPDITYSFYPVYAQLWNIPYKTPELNEDFSVDLKPYAEPCGGVVIANPNAPTGRALSAAPLLELARALEKHNRVLIVDEAYAAFGAESLVPYIKDHPNLLTVHTLSKSASLAGLRVGFAIGNEELIQGLCRIRDSFNSYTMDALALAGGKAAVLDKRYYDAINQKVIATREQTAASLTALGFESLPSKSNFLFISGRGITSSQNCASGLSLFQALRNRGILVRHFNKPRIADFLRVSMGTPKDMETFLAVCKELIK
jgi:histidinol-phosphate aminotransferase